MDIMNGGLTMHDNSAIKAGEIRSYGKLEVPVMTKQLIDLIKTGKIYSLEQIIEPGIPYWSGHQPLAMTTLLRHGDNQDFRPTSIANEYLSLPMHGGTHIDALCHIGKYDGNNVTLFDGVDAKSTQKSYGQAVYGAENFPPLVMRGLLLDVASSKGLDILPPSYGINGEDIKACEEMQGTKVTPNTAVLIRTGYEHYWVSDNAKFSGEAAGLNVDGAQYLVSKGAAIIGADNEAVDQMPPCGAGLPVHQYLIVENGVTHIEALHLEELAKDKVYEFLFICLPLRIKGATGSIVHPIAIG